MKKKIKKRQKQDINVKYFLHNLFLYLNDAKYNPDILVLKKLKGMDAYYDGDVIVIDPRKELLPSLIHEFIHKMYEEYPESLVKKCESKIINSLTIKQFKNIIRVLGNILD